MSGGSAQGFVWNKYSGNRRDLPTKPVLAFLQLARPHSSDSISASLITWCFAFGKKIVPLFMKNV